MVFNGGGIMNKNRILLYAPVLTRSGYGEQSRFALRALRSRPDLFDIFIQPLEWGNTSWITDDTEERRFIDQMIEKTIIHVQNNGGFDSSLQVTIPNEWNPIHPRNIGYTAGMETTRIDAAWIEPSNKMDKIIVVSNHSKNVYESTVYEQEVEGTNDKRRYMVTTPIDAVGYPVKKFENAEVPDLSLDTDYNFLCVAQMGPRKNIDSTIKWFIDEFKDDADVGLVLKTNFAKNCQVDREVCHGRVLGIVNQYPDKKCKIYLLHGDMTDEELHGIYKHPKISAALSCTHGEGFGLPLFEAAYMGAPVVAPGWSGQLDFLCDENGKSHFYNISFDIQPIPENVVWQNVIPAGSMWCYPRENSARQQMRQCIDDVKKGTAQAAASQYAAQLQERFDEQALYHQFIEALGIDFNEEELDVENWLAELDIEEIE